jgi:hypothetical protein
MAITTGDGLMAALAAADFYAWAKNSNAVPASNQQYSLWATNGSPVAGAVPGAAATCTTATTGAVPFTYAGGSSLAYVGYFTTQALQLACMVVYDRLAHMGGLSGTSVAAQTVSLSVPGSRLASADLTNVEWYLEVYSDLGSSGQTATVTYVNTSSVSHTVGITVPGTARAGLLTRVIPTVSGDVIQSITSIQLAGSTGTAGNFGFTCARRLVQSAASNMNEIDIQDVMSSGMGQIPNNACLWFTFLSSGASTLTMSGSLKIIQG